MPKVPTMALVRKRPKAETRTFIDPAYPELPFTLTMAPADVLAGARMQAAAEELIAEYLEGPDGPVPFPIAQEQEGGIGEFNLDTPVESLYLNRPLIESACGMWAGQAGPEAERYTPQEMVAASLTLPDAYAEALKWVGELNERRQRGNASSAALDPSTGPRSSSASPTPNPASSSEATSTPSTNGQAASTNGSALSSGIYGSVTPETTEPESASTLPPLTS